MSFALRTSPAMILTILHRVKTKVNWITWHDYVSVNISRRPSVTHLSPENDKESNGNKNRGTISAFSSTQLTQKEGRNGLNLISDIGVENATSQSELVLKSWNRRRERENMLLEPPSAGKLATSNNRRKSSNQCQARGNVRRPSEGWFRYCSWLFGCSDWLDLVARTFSH